MVYSDDTVVTKLNVTGILDSLGIKHGKIQYSKDMSNCKYTVKDLKRALLEYQNENKTAIRESSNYFQGSTMAFSSAIQSSKTKQKKISMKLHHDGYDLIHIEQVKYRGKYFKSVTSSDIKIDSDLFPLVYKITKERNISATCSKTLVKQKFDINITTYIGVKYGIIPIGTSRHKGTVNFYASKYL